MSITDENVLRVNTATVAKQPHSKMTAFTQLSIKTNKHQ